MSVAGRRIEIRGTVQGVGFRPFVYRLAQKYALAGSVRNDSNGVTIEAFGDPAQLDRFVNQILSSPPPAAKIRTVQSVAIASRAGDRFTIVESGSGPDRRVSIPVDLPTCDDCLREIFEPNNRRYRYPFTNCTNCGPRFTIARDVPYDRPATTMASFDMCPDCQREYDRPEDRRFHAQPNACRVCGPRLRAVTPRGTEIQMPDPIEFAARALICGSIVAVKGIGGFHLACDATSSSAVSLLRQRKRREEKPFAVMVRDLAAAGELALLRPEHEALLTSVERPVVLAPKRPGSRLANEVAPSNALVGLLLPYSPLHHLLLADAGRPLVMTSGNVSEEPMAYRNEEALDQLGGIADLFLLHDREIETRLDDSVATLIGGRPVVFRRARGYVPSPVAASPPIRQPVLACGAHLKNTFAIASGDSVFLGPHIGDLENAETLRSYEDAILKMKRFLGIEPRVVAHDLHPDYLSTRYALAQKNVVTVPVQHHHAHIASAMAEHSLAGAVIGVAYDGTGYGTDRTAWGGEILVADFLKFRRLATFRPIRLAGSHAAIRQVWRLALALLDDAYDQAPPLHAFPIFRAVPGRAIEVMRKMISEEVNAPLAHGVGRYFDAFGALFLDRCDSNYEGQVALEWNMAADPKERGPYPVVVHKDRSPWEIDLRMAVRSAVDDMMAGRSVAAISACFHNTLVHATAVTVKTVAEVAGKLPVVLSGGCFQNALLSERLQQELAGEFQIYTHCRVPPGDGGIALGQALVADAVVNAKDKPGWLAQLERGDLAGFAPQQEVSGAEAAPVR